MISDLFLRRMQRGRIRQLSISAVSLILAGLCVAIFSAAELGGFSYYTIIILLVINSVLALLQFQQVIRPIEALLEHIASINARIDANDYRPPEQLSTGEGDAFGCVAASIDTMVEKLTTRINSLNDASATQDDMLMSMPYAIFILTREGTVAKLLNANGLGNTLRGFRIGEKPREDFWGRDNIQAMQTALNRANASSETIWCDMMVKRLDGRGEEIFRTTFRRLNGMSVMMTLLNATDRKDIGAPAEAAKPAQPEAKPSEDAAQTRAMLKRMAASIAHDGKNILAALNNLVIINRESTDPNVREQIPLAEDTIRKGTMLMQELATYAGEMRLNLQCQAPAGAFSKLLTESAIKAILPSTVRFQSVISEKPMPEIDLDSDQMWKVIFNLVKNAIEAMNGVEGRITVKVEPYQMSDEAARDFHHAGILRKGPGVLVSVVDDGPGISEEMIGRIFEPYFSDKGEGRGIGLATAMTIIDAHGAAISVKSSKGSGTTFSIYLPASRNTAEELKAIREIAPNGELLLVDDDPTILHTTSLVLRALKIAAHPASSEEDALAKLRSLRGRIRLALIDGNIGCVCSSSLVRHIHNEFPQLPVIIVSGSPKETIDSRFSGVPYSKFLAKPYSVTDLSAAIDEVAPLKQ